MGQTDRQTEGRIGALLNAPVPKTGGMIIVLTGNRAGIVPR